MPDLVFTIKTPAELAGTEAALSQLKELKRQAIAAGVSTGDLDSQITKAEGAIAKFSKAQKTGGEETKGHEEKIHGLNKAMGLLARAGGEAGQALNHLWHLGGNPLTLGLAVLALAVDVAVEKFKAMREAVEETKQKLRELNRANFDSFASAISRAAEAQAEYNRTVAAAGEDKDKLKTLFDQRQEFLEAEIKAIGENIKAQEELAIARYKAAHAGEKGNEKEIAAGEANIRAGFANQRSDLNKSAGNARIGLMEEERTRRDDAGPLIDYNTAKNRLNNFDTRSSVDDPANHLSRLKTEAAKLDKKAEEANSQDNNDLIKKNRAIVQQLTVEFGERSPEVEKAKANLQTLLDTQTAANVALRENTIKQADYARQIDDNKAKLAELTAEVAKAKAAYEGNNARVADLGEKISTARGVQRIENTAADKRAVDARFAPVLDTGISQSEATAGRVSRREKITQEESGQLRTFGSMIAGHEVNVDTAAKMFVAAKNNKQIEADFLSRLMSAVERLAQNNGPAAGQLEARLKALENQVANQRKLLQGAYNP